MKQNLLFCLLFSSLGGLCKILATIILIIPSDIEKKTSIPLSTSTKILAIIGNLILQTCTGVFFTLAPMFGPVSIYTPTSISSILLSNMFILWLVLRREAFSKDMRVATYICVLAVIVLPVVGPAVQEDQNVGALLLRPVALIWMIFLLLVFVISTIYMFTIDLRNVEDPIVAEICLFGVGVFASALMPTMARAMVIVEGLPQYLLIGFYVLVQPVLGYEAMLESVAVPSRGKFVPMCSAGTVLLNALTGIILWGDWGVTENHVAYICVLLMLLEGVYLISDYDFFPRDITIKRKVSGPLMDGMSLSASLNGNGNGNVLATKESDDLISNASYGSTTSGGIEIQESAISTIC